MTNQDRVDVVEGDITRVKADAIVNAANTDCRKAVASAARFLKPPVSTS